jgi:hypothetical protein
MQYAYEVHISVPPLKEVPFVSLLIVSIHVTIIVEAALRWGNASVISPAVVTRRVGSFFRPDDWDMEKGRRQSDASHGLHDSLSTSTWGPRPIIMLARNSVYSHNGKFDVAHHVL